MEHNIKRGITIYSWYHQVDTGTLTWEDCIRAAVKMGCNGLELLGQLYFRYCPEVLPEDLASWEELMWKYGTKTIAHDFFVDKTLYAHRNLTVREGVDIVKRHAQFAKAIHCPIMRVGGQVDPEIFRQSVPILEKLGIKMGLEIHSGSSSFCLPQVQKVIEVIRQIGGFISINHQYIGILIKVIGVSYICEFSSSLCKDAGYSAIASQIEVAGKLTILVMSMPILMSLLDIVGSFL